MAINVATASRALFKLQPDPCCKSIFISWPCLSSLQPDPSCNCNKNLVAISSGPLLKKASPLVDLRLGGCRRHGPVSPPTASPSTLSSANLRRLLHRSSSSLEQHAAAPFYFLLSFFSSPSSSITFLSPLQISKTARRQLPSPPLVGLQLTSCFA